MNNELQKILKQIPNLKKELNNLNSLITYYENGNFNKGLSTKNKNRVRELENKLSYYFYKLKNSIESEKRSINLLNDPNFCEDKFKRSALNIKCNLRKAKIKEIIKKFWGEFYIND